MAAGLALGGALALAGQEPSSPAPDAAPQQQTRETGKDAAAGGGAAPATKTESNSTKAEDKTGNTPEPANENPSGAEPEAKKEAKPDAQAPATQAGTPTPPMQSPATQTSATPKEDQSKSGPAESRTGASKEEPAGSSKEGPEVESQSESSAENRKSTGNATVPAPRKKPRKVVVREGGASEPAAQIVTGMTVEEASSQGQETEKLLDSSEEYLRRLLGRPLDSEQQQTVSQIHNYEQRARVALKEGDISRGHTLATKANLLAEDLLKH